MQLACRLFSGLFIFLIFSSPKAEEHTNRARGRQRERGGGRERERGKGKEGEGEGEPLPQSQRVPMKRKDYQVSI